MAQATTLEKAFAGPKDSKGRQVYPGFLFDTGIASTQGIPACCTAVSSRSAAGVHRSGWTSTLRSSGRSPIRPRA